jgi:hypothetical protein
LFAFSYESLKIWVITWSPRRETSPTETVPVCSLASASGTIFSRPPTSATAKAEAAQRGEEAQVRVARRERLLAVQGDVAAHPRVDDELLLQDHAHRPCDAFDVGVDEVQRDRVAAERAAVLRAWAKAVGAGSTASASMDEAIEVAMIFWRTRTGRRGAASGFMLIRSK